MKCRECNASKHGHEGVCRLPVTEDVRVGRGLHDPFGYVAGYEVIGTCDCDVDQYEAAEQHPAITAVRQAFDSTLREHVFFTMDDSDGFVTCVDGDLDTLDAAVTLIIELLKADWSLVRIPT